LGKDDAPERLIPRHHHGKIKSFPKDDPSKKPHFTAFMSYKDSSSEISEMQMHPMNICTLMCDEISPFPTVQPPKNSARLA
jgi:hypothetical protein